MKWYDYNGTKREKDQCDRESAGAKSLIQSYVDAGHDLVSADVADGLKYGSGLKKSVVSVVSIEKSAAILGKKIQKIKSFFFWIQWITHENLVIFQCWERITKTIQ